MGEPSDHDAREAFSEFTLDGDRFRDGRLPIDALVELERYRALLLAAAERAWRLDNPDTDLPQDFDREFDLAIRDVDEGSAISVLERPESIYGAYFDEGRDTVDQVFREMVKGLDPKALEGGAPRENSSPLDPELVEAIIDLGQRRAFRDLGASLEADEVAVFPQRDSDIRVTMGVRARSVRPIVQKVRQIVTAREHRVATVAGRLIALNAERRNYTLDTLLFGSINGRYSDPSMTANLRAVLDSSSQAPVVRIEGRMSWVNGRLEKILDVDEVELFEVDTEPWSRRLVELATLQPNWGEEGESGNMISFAALDAVREIIRAVSDVSPESPFPGISPTEEGGVHVQWVSEDQVTSIDIDPDAALFAHFLHVSAFGTDQEVQTARDLETQDLAAAIQFVREVNL